jgi:hypothetical protein
MGSDRKHKEAEMKAIIATTFAALTGVLAPGALAGEPIRLAALYGYAIEVKKELNGLNVDVRSSGGPLAVLTLHNRSSATARCKAVFNSGVQTPVGRQAKVKSGKTVQMTYPVPGEITALKITLSCAKHKGAGERSGSG